MSQTIDMQTGVLNLYACAGALAAKMNYTDKDIVHFLTNVECVPFSDSASISTCWPEGFASGAATF
jgi:hypothetical protein